MQISRTGLALALALGGAMACGDDANAPVDPTVTFAMNAVNGNGITGTVTIEDQPGNGATVTVTLRGLTPDGQHAGHIHVGTCANQGAIVAGLNPVTADAQGTGSATTTGVPDELLGAGQYVQYHVALNPSGAPMSCADIPASQPGTDGGGGGY
jgi:hypothetical protein